MCIDIQFEKVVKNSEPCVKITKAKALPKRRLPNEYLNGYPCCVGSNQSGDRIEVWYKDLVGDRHALQLVKGEIVSEKYFLRAFNRIKKCGKRLKRINDKNRKRLAKEDWQGKGRIQL